MQSMSVDYNRSLNHYKPGLTLNIDDLYESEILVQELESRRTSSGFITSIIAWRSADTTVLLTSGWNVDRSIELTSVCLHIIRKWNNIKSLQKTSYPNRPLSSILGLLSTWIGGSIGSLRGSYGLEESGDDSSKGFLLAVDLSVLKAAKELFCRTELVLIGFIFNSFVISSFRVYQITGESHSIASQLYLKCKRFYSF